MERKIYTAPEEPYYQRANGLNEIFPRSEWDGWDEAKIEEYYSGYVFKRENRRQ
ncbi:MAG: hypothetical protein WHS82_02445 [Candidatus Methanosuratincola sp.]